MARGWKFRIQEEEELCYQCSENKSAYQLRCYCEADLRLCFRIFMQNVDFLMTRLIYSLVYINFYVYSSALVKINEFLIFLCRSFKGKIHADAYTVINIYNIQLA